MIIVTGTKRSGTSMWMQILDAAGLPRLGEAFPRNWEETLKDANPHGFYETPLRRGIYYATNPHPTTGAYLQPKETRQVAVKVFIPGLCRTDHAFIHRVVGTMRHWREYAASIERMREMEEKAARERHGEDHKPLERLDPVLEWWLENFALIRNMITRRLPVHLVTYDRVVDTPSETLPPVLEWLGANAEEIDAAVDVVSPETRTQTRKRIERDHDFEGIFDDLYDLIHSGRKLTGEFIQRLNEAHKELIPAIEEDRRRVMKDRRRRRGEPKAKPSSLHPDTLETLVHGGDERES